MTTTLLRHRTIISAGNDEMIFFLSVHSIFQRRVGFLLCNLSIRGIFVYTFCFTMYSIYPCTVVMEGNVTNQIDYT